MNGKVSCSRTFDPTNPPICIKGLREHQVDLTTNNGQREHQVDLAANKGQCEDDVDLAANNLSV